MSYSLAQPRKPEWPPVWLTASQAIIALRWLSAQRPWKFLQQASEKRARHLAPWTAELKNQLAQRQLAWRRIVPRELALRALAPNWMAAQLL
jgi:hypothetical protein